MVPPYAPPPQTHNGLVRAVYGPGFFRLVYRCFGTKSKTITRCFGTKSKTSTVFLNTFVRSGGFRSSPVCRIRTSSCSTIYARAVLLSAPSDVPFRFVFVASSSRPSRLASRPRGMAPQVRPRRSPRSLAPPRLAAGRVAAARARARRGRAGPDRGCAVRCRGLSHIESALCAVHRAETIRH